MSTETEVVALFERANPFPEPDAIDIVVSADQRLADALNDERGPVAVIDGTQTTTPAPGRRGWVIPAAAAAVLVIALVAALSVVGGETEPSDSIPSTIAPVPTTTVPDESADSPSAAELAVVDAFFTAYNDGDTDAVLAMLAEGAFVTEFDPEEPYLDWDQRLAWNLAQGETLTEPTCDLPVERPAEGATLLCTYETLDAVVQAVDGRPIPTSTFFTVVEGELTVIDQRYGFPDFATLGTPFTQWMEANHPDVTGALSHGWTSREEAVESGLLRAQWAQEWALSLEEPGCEPLAICSPTLGEESASVLDEVAMAPALSAASDGETQETIVGGITWTRLAGDITTQPEHVEFVLDGDFFGTDTNGTTWRSPDGITWTRQVTSLGDVSEVIEVAGETWAVLNQPGSQSAAPQHELTRWDRATFEPFTLPASGAPVVDGLRRSSRSLSLIESGGLLGVLVDETYAVPWDDHLGGRGWTVEAFEDGILAMRNHLAGGRVLLDTTVDAGETGVVTFRSEGQPDFTVGPWPDIDAETLQAQLVDDGVHHGELLIGEPGALEPVAPPWPGANISGAVALEDGLLAMVGAPHRPQRELWALADGDWERRPTPTTLITAADHALIVGGGRSAILTIDGDPSRGFRAWQTSDGSNWQAANGGRTWAMLRHADFGWTGMSNNRRRPGIVVSPDGITWQAISVDLPAPDGGFSIGNSSLADTIMFSMSEQGGARVMWVGKVEPG